MKNKNTKCMVCHALIKTDESVALNVRTGKVTHAKCYLAMRDLAVAMELNKLTRRGSKYVK